MVGIGREAIDLTGQRFTRLLVLGRSKRRSDKYGSALWDCRCDCGTVAMILGRHLRDRSTRSCGCIRREVASLPNEERRPYDG